MILQHQVLFTTSPQGRSLRMKVLKEDEEKVYLKYIYYALSLSPMLLYEEHCSPFSEQAKFSHLFWTIIFISIIISNYCLIMISGNVIALNCSFSHCRLNNKSKNPLAWIKTTTIWTLNRLNPYLIRVLLPLTIEDIIYFVLAGTLVAMNKLVSLHLYQYYGFLLLFLVYSGHV